MSISRGSDAAWNPSPDTAGAAPRDLAFTPEVERATGDVWARLRRVVPEIEWPVHAPLIAAINRLKRERNAVILAHNYQTPGDLPRRRRPHAATRWRWRARRPRPTPT